LVCGVPASPLYFTCSPLPPRGVMPPAPYVLSTSRFPLPAICAIKGTKGATVPGPSPARLRERWRVSHDL
jgi:hypothetical protein